MKSSVVVLTLGFSGWGCSAETTLEAEIDLLVYRLYGLSWAEVKLVDPEFGMWEEEYEAVEV